MRSVAGTKKMLMRGIDKAVAEDANMPMYKTASGDLVDYSGMSEAELTKFLEDDFALRFGEEDEEDFYGEGIKNLLALDLKRGGF